MTSQSLSPVQLQRVKPRTLPLDPTVVGPRTSRSDDRDMFPPMLTSHCLDMGSNGPDIFLCSIQ
jgi:hypothetical protein